MNSEASIIYIPAMSASNLAHLNNSVDNLSREIMFLRDSKLASQISLDINTIANFPILDEITSIIVTSPIETVMSEYNDLGDIYESSLDLGRDLAKDEGFMQMLESVSGRTNVPYEIVWEFTSDNDVYLDILLKMIGDKLNSKDGVRYDSSVEISKIRAISPSTPDDPVQTGKFCKSIRITYGIGKSISELSSIVG